MVMGSQTISHRSFLGGVTQQLVTSLQAQYGEQYSTVVAIQHQMRQQQLPDAVPWIDGPLRTDMSGMV